MRILGVLPARMAATRLPNKPMALIQGMPMIGHCYLRSRMCTTLDEVYVATCDIEIKEYIESIGGKAIMTSDTHERATERAAEAMLNIEKETNCEPFDIVVMIQGDEPLVDPKMIEESIEPITKEGAIVSNLMAYLETQEERDNPNNVKVALDLQKNALYFSREAIPSNKKYSGKIDAFRQLGLIAFKRDSLLKFISLPTSPLEIIESVDMNRLVENRIPIKMTATKFKADSVDTLEDLKRVEVKMREDALAKIYNKQI